MRQERYCGTQYGTAVIYKLAAASGFSAEVTDYGASLISLVAPDKHGVLRDVVLGYGEYADRAQNPFYFGSTIGRVAGRVSGAKFRIGSREYNLFANDGVNHLHGGSVGFSHRLWETVESCDSFVKFRLCSPPMDEGYPGELDVSVTYSLADDGGLTVLWEASAGADTPVALTNHAYFNLSDEPTIEEHKLHVDAGFYFPVGKGLAPTGEIFSVKGSPFDFTLAKPIGRDINKSDEQLSLAGGYDHGLILRNPDYSVRCASLYSDISGILLEVFTTQPALHIYSGNYLGGFRLCRDGFPVRWRQGICLMTGHYPDSVNNPHFPSIMLRPGERYEHKTTYKLSIK